MASKKTAAISFEIAWRDLIVRMLHEPAEWTRNYLRLRQQSGLDRFGFWGNRLLLAGALGGAGLPVSRVMTETGWRRQGRLLRPDAKEILIYAIFGSTSPSASIRPLYRERCFIEFDVQDTEGPDLHPLPDPPEVDVSPATVERLLSQLDVCRRLLRPKKEITIIEALPEAMHTSLRAALGATNGEWIYLRPDLPSYQRARVYAHEIAHIVLGHTKERRNPLVDGSKWRSDLRADQEVAADLVALVISATWGVDVHEHTEHYLAHWQRSRLNVDEMADQVLVAVRQIFSLIPPPTLNAWSRDAISIRSLVDALCQSIGDGGQTIDSVLNEALRQPIGRQSSRFSQQGRKISRWYLQEVLRLYEGRFWRISGRVIRTEADPQLTTIKNDDIHLLRPYPESRNRTWKMDHAEMRLQALSQRIEIISTLASGPGLLCYELTAWTGGGETSWKVIALDDGRCLVKRSESTELGDGSHTAVKLNFCPGWTTEVPDSLFGWGMEAIDAFLCCSMAEPLVLENTYEAYYGDEGHLVKQIVAIDVVPSDRLEEIQNGLSQILEAWGRLGPLIAHQVFETRYHVTAAFDAKLAYGAFSDSGGAVVIVGFHWWDQIDSASLWSARLFAPASVDAAEHLLDDERGILLKAQNFIDRGHR